MYYSASDMNEGTLRCVIIQHVVATEMPLSARIYP